MRRLTIDEYNAETARMKLHAEAQAVQQKHAVELSKEQMKGEHVAMTQDAKTQHIAIAEDAKANTAIEVARINADSRQDVAELQGLIQLLLAKMQPPQPLAIEVASDEAEEAQSETTGEAE
jgi:hypothetical protein